MRRVYVDLETTGLDPRRDRLALVTLLADGGAPIALPADTPGLAERVAAMLAAADEVVAHRSTFDLVWLNVTLGVPIPERVWDSWLAEEILLAGTGESAALAAAVARRLGRTLDKSLQRSLVGADDVTVDADMIAYAVEDVAVLPELVAAQQRELRRLGLERTWAIEQDALPAFLRAMTRGVPMNRERLVAAIDHERERVTALRRLLVDRLGPHAEEARLARLDAERERLDRWLAEREQVRASAVDRAAQREAVRRWQADHPRPPRPRDALEPFNPDAPLQVRAALAGLGYDVPSVDVDTLLTTTFDEATRREIIQPLLDYRKASKLVSAFGDALLNAIHGERVYADINPSGAASGRPTAARPNLLQLPRDPRFRAAVQAPPGRRLVVCDYSQMELRIAAELSGDAVMVDAFRSGADVHLETARRLFGPSAGDAERTLAKTCVYLTLYGGGPQRLAEQVARGGSRLTLAEARQVLDDWKRVHARLWAAVQHWQREAMRTREARSPWGRRRGFPPDAPAWEVARSGANFVIQAANADVTKVAMAAIERALAPLGGGVLLNVYDEVIAEVPAEHAELGARIVQQGMLAAAELMLRRVPAEAEVAVGVDWSCK